MWNKIVEFLKNNGRYIPIVYDILKKILEYFKKKEKKKDGTK